MSISRESPLEILDPNRLAALKLSGLLDSEPEDAFDRFTTLAHQILGLPVVLISLIAEDRQFFKSTFGLPEPYTDVHETPLSYSLCKYVVADKAPLIISDARLHPRVKDSPAVSEIGIVAYAGVPLRTADDQVIGSFCAIDMEPHVWEPREIEVLHSLAEMVMREVALRQLARSLYVRNEALQIAETRRDDLVNMTIHDLRTPLTSLLSGLQTLNDFLDLEEIPRQIMDLTLRGARSLSEMIDTILDVSRGEAGLMTLDCRPVTARATVISALEQVEYYSRQRSLQMSFNIDPAVPLIDADGKKLERVVVNLLGNAIRHTSSGGQIGVEVRMAPDAETVIWSVSDTGVGIIAADLERIFEKFGQSRSSAKMGPSTGLGLTFCRMVVEAHGGHIWAQSQLGVGSTFFFDLPVAASSL